MIIWASAARADRNDALQKRTLDPIGGLTGKIVELYRTPCLERAHNEESDRGTMPRGHGGYIVYRSDKEDGTYYQASPLLFERNGSTRAPIVRLQLVSRCWISRIPVGVFRAVSCSRPLCFRLQTMIPDAVQEMMLPKLHRPHKLFRRAGFRV